MNFSHYPPVTHNDPDTISAKSIQCPERKFPSRAAFCLLFHLIPLRDTTDYCHSKRDTHHIIPLTCVTGSSFIFVFCAFSQLMLPMRTG
ncbi:TPA: hypothetical protein MCO94_001686 [Klebsiella pneumoniae]|nr:hypothetical protein [Klebsiella pneumoniae]KAA5745859.1 hypothetical protein F3G17_08040 [Klebsiella pneumoniae]KAA5769773.1 hypothetical protein F3G19_14265 [Klebsiella pneumoniae]MBA1422209.1 hypothetical protein [Klebsiella pneumoniae]MBE0101206.1 hypothetical protein [Klebsiella pneumoniae]